MLLARAVRMIIDSYVVKVHPGKSRAIDAQPVHYAEAIIGLRSRRGRDGWQKNHLRKGKPRVPKAVLRLPRLDQAKSAVLNSLSSIELNAGTGVQSRSSLNGSARSR